MTFQYYGPLASGSRLYQQREGVDPDGQRLPNLAKYIEDACVDAAYDGVCCYYTVTGSRQSGKTSLLMDIYRRIKAAGGYPCWLDFQRAYGASPEQSVNYVARQILRAIPELSASTQVPDDFKNDGQEFTDWLSDLPLPQEKPVVLLMEELGALPIDSRMFLGGQLRSAFVPRSTESWSKAVLVLFGGIELHDMTSVEVSPFFNICMNLPLLDLDSKVSNALLVCGFDKIKESDANNLDKLCQSIYYQVSGHPYLTQFLGDKALSYYKKHGVLPEDIQSILFELNTNNFEYLWSNHYLCCTFFS